MSTPWYRRLADGLSKSRERLGGQLNVLLRRGPNLDDEFWSDLEDALIGADMGFTATTEIVERLKTESARRALPDAASVIDLLVDEIAVGVHASRRRPPRREPRDRPARGRQRHRQDHDGRQARQAGERRGAPRAPRQRRHLPRRSRGAARRVGRARPRPRGSSRARRGPRVRRVRDLQRGPATRARTSS